MNTQTKLQHLRYISLCTKKLLSAKTTDEEFTPEEDEDLNLIQKELGGNHQRILITARRLLINNVVDHGDNK